MRCGFLSRRKRPQPVTDLPKNAEQLLPVSLAFDFNVEKLVVEYCSRKCSTIMPFIPKLGRSWQPKIKEVAEIKTMREDRTTVASSVLSLRFEMYANCTPLKSKADHSLPEIAQYEVGRRELDT